MEEEITLEEEQERALQEQMDIGKSLDLFQFRWLGNNITENFGNHYPYFRAYKTFHVQPSKMKLVLLSFISFEFMSY